MRPRRDGWRATLEAARLPVEDELFLTGSWSEARRRAATERLLAAAAQPPDAVLGGPDQIARGVADGSRERGVALLAEVAIVGFDNRR